MTLEIIKATAPSHWSRYLINGDSSALSLAEQTRIEMWLKLEDMGLPVSCEDAGFLVWHDAKRFAESCDCQMYEFLVEVE